MSFQFLNQLSKGIPLLDLKTLVERNPNVPHAPVRRVPLTLQEKELAVSNSLRYFPPSSHEALRPEFHKELEDYGHIYMYRLIPDFPMRAYPIQEYPGKTLEGRAIMMMICNNLDPAVAQFPHELVTYGGNGQVFSNWAQFWLVMKYLSEMDDKSTLVMYSGHPLGLFPSRDSGAPRVIVTNGMMVPNYSKPEDYDKYFALGVTSYGQMTAGSYCYIGPQGIVHGTTITLLNAGRKYLNTNSLKGKLFVTSGLGGMSGAQAKAAVIAGCVGVIAEVSWDALKKRHEQGWLQEIVQDLEQLVIRIKQAKATGEARSIGYFGNVVDLWEKLAEECKSSGESLVELGSDQTSLHNPYNGGYYPVSLGYEEAQKMMVSDPEKFKGCVQASLRRQVVAINTLAEAGMRFWDYGNAFLLEAGRAGAQVFGEKGPSKFIYPSYVEDIMGDIFSLGFGPFRWVCCSGLKEDLEITDHAAIQVFEELLEEKDVEPEVAVQYEENLKWIRAAGEQEMVVGGQARILYSDCMGRRLLASKFNELIRSGKLKGPVVISRDHHDVSGADSPYRETSNVGDGSKFTADMSVQNFIGDGIRGATWVALHNGGGVGWGEVMNGGFGLVLNGRNSEIAENLLLWDVNNGIARRAWAGNKYAIRTIKKEMERTPGLKVTIPQ